MLKGPKTSEKDVLRAVTTYLEGRNITYIRNARFKPVLTKGGRICAGPIKPSQRGISDILIFHKGTVYAVELKSSIGKLSDDQVSWSLRFSGAMGDNGRFLVIKTVEELMVILGSEEEKKALALPSTMRYVSI